MKLKNKKALSNVVVVVFFIALAAIAITTLFTTLKPVFNPKLSPEEACIFKEKPAIIKSACYNNQTGDLEIDLRLNREKEDIFFIINYKDESSTWCCGKECDSCKTDFQKIYYINIQKPESISVKIGKCLVDSKDVPFC